MILKKKNMSIYYEICYVNSIACAGYSPHCDGFSLYPKNKNKKK